MLQLLWSSPFLAALTIITLLAPQVFALTSTDDVRVSFSSVAGRRALKAIVRAAVRNDLLPQLTPLSQDNTDDGPKLCQGTTAPKVKYQYCM